MKSGDHAGLVGLWTGALRKMILGPDELIFHINIPLLVPEFRIPCLSGLRMDQEHRVRSWVQIREQGTLEEHWSENERPGLWIPPGYVPALCLGSPSASLSLCLLICKMR